MKPDDRSDTRSEKLAAGNRLGNFPISATARAANCRSLCSRPLRRPNREKPCRPGKLTAESPLSRPRELGREAGNDTNLSAHGSDGGAKTKLRARITKRSASHPSILALLKATPPSQTRERFETKKPRDSPEPRGFCCTHQTGRHLHCATAKPLRISSVPPSVLAFPKAQLGHTPGTSRRKGRCSISCEDRTCIRKEHCYNGSRFSSGTKKRRRQTECQRPSATHFDPDQGQKKVNWESVSK